MPPKILIMGSGGQLGWECQRTFQSLGVVKCVDYPNIDLKNPVEVKNIILDYSPNVIVNAAAFTAVDKAENESEVAFKVNADAPAVMAESAKKINAVFVHFSTDYVFDGSKNLPYTEKDIPNPINIYGKSKLIGENNIIEIGGLYLIFRTSWVYSLRANSFVKKVLDWSHSQEVVNVVTDQVGSPTWARSLAEMTTQVICNSQWSTEWFKEHKGLFHLAGCGAVSRFDFAKAIIALDNEKEKQVLKKLIESKTSDFPTPAARPLYSALDCSLFISKFNLYPPFWLDTLKLALG